MLSEQQGLTFKDVAGTIWFLFLCACAAAYFGYINVPAPIVNAWDSLNGNAASEFDIASMPDPQRRFVGIVSKKRDEYIAAENDLAKSAVRDARRKELCETSEPFQTDAVWTGVVETLTTNGDGKGVLAVKIAPHVTVQTWNNGLSDIGSETLLPIGSDLFQAAQRLKDGQRVKFTGNFFQSGQDCIEEGSLTIDGAMTDPEFIIRFRSLTPA